MLYEPDYRLTGVPRKNITISVKGIKYSHNSNGFRGREFPPKKVRKQIACFGGSSTYGVNVNNDETWPAILDSLLPEHDVLNFGISGHSTAEHKILLQQVLEQYTPDHVLINAGLNDLRSMNVSNLSPDYNNFHQPTLFGSFGFCPQQRLPRSGLVTASWIVLRKGGIIKCCQFHQAIFTGTLSDTPDTNVLTQFNKNIDSLIIQCSEKNIPVSFVPQILSADVVTESGLKWWIPYLSKQGILNALTATNEVMKGKDNGKNIRYLNLTEVWSNDDFADESHLSKSGNQKVAHAIFNRIADAR